VPSIDSPGGGALTSDLIWREIELKRIKPIVVSMEIMQLQADNILLVTQIQFLLKKHNHRFYIGV
jgi:hypothetical protein